MMALQRARPADGVVIFFRFRPDPKMPMVFTPFAAVLLIEDERHFVYTRSIELDSVDTRILSVFPNKINEIITNQPDTQQLVVDLHAAYQRGTITAYGARKVKLNGTYPRDKAAGKLLDTELKKIPTA